MKRLLAILALGAAAGCSSTSQPRNPFESQGGASSTTIRINVENNNFNEATIRSVARTERRLGTVPGNGRESFTIDWPAVNDLRLQIDILAGDRFTTNRIQVSPGENVYLTITNPIYRSLLRR